jgi:hypothetical protein
MAAPDDSVLLAKTAPRIKDGHACTALTLVCLPSTWRIKPPSNYPTINKGDLLGYLNPAGLLLPIARADDGNGKSSAAPSRKRRVIDHPEFSFMLPPSL